MEESLTTPPLLLWMGIPLITTALIACLGILWLYLSKPFRRNRQWSQELEHHFRDLATTIKEKERGDTIEKSWPLLTQRIDENLSKHFREMSTTLNNNEPLAAIIDHLAQLQQFIDEQLRLHFQQIPLALQSLAPQSPELGPLFQKLSQNLSQTLTQQLSQQLSQQVSQQLSQQLSQQVSPLEEGRLSEQLTQQISAQITDQVNANLREFTQTYLQQISQVALPLNNAQPEDLSEPYQNLQTLLSDTVLQAQKQITSKMDEQQKAQWLFSSKVEEFIQAKVEEYLKRARQMQQEMIEQTHDKLMDGLNNQHLSLTENIFAMQNQWGVVEQAIQSNKDQLSAKIEQATKTLSGLRDEVAGQTQRSSDLKTTVLSTNQEFLQQLEEGLGQIDALQNALRSLEDQSHKAATQVQKHSGVVKEDHQAFTKQLGEFKQTLSQLTTERTQMQKQIKQLESHLQETQAVKQQTTDQVLQLTSQIQRSQENSTHWQQKWQHLNQELEVLNKTLQQQKELLKDREEHLHSAQQEIAILKQNTLVAEKQGGVYRFDKKDKPQRKWIKNQLIDFHE